MVHFYEILHANEAMVEQLVFSLDLGMTTLLIKFCILEINKWRGIMNRGQGSENPKGFLGVIGVSVDYGADWNKILNITY